MKQFKNEIKQNVNQITMLKRDLRTTKRKVSQQERSVVNLKFRINDYDKKFETTSRKLNAVMEELSKCKTELQYWRSKSPLNATPLNGWRMLGANEMDIQLPDEIFQPIDDVSDMNMMANGSARDKQSDNNKPLNVIKSNELSESGLVGINGESSCQSLCKRKLDYVDPKEQQVFTASSKKANRH